MFDEKLDRELSERLEKEYSGVPKAVGKKVDDTLATLSRARTRRRYPVFAAALALMLIAGVLGTSRFSFFEFPGLSTAERQVSVDGFNRISIQNGVTMQVDKVLYDGQRIFVHYRMKSPHKIQLEKPVQWYIWTGGEDMGYSLGEFKRYQTGENEYAGLFDIHLLDEMPDQFDATLNFWTKIDGEQTLWSFDLLISKMSGQDKVMKPGLEVSSGDRTLRVNKITQTPISTAIDMTYIHPWRNEEAIMFRLINGKGEVIPWASGPGGLMMHADGEMGISHTENIFKPLDPETKSVTVQPFLAKAFLHSSTRTDSAKLEEPYPIELNRGEVGHVVITDFRRGLDHAYVEYKVSGPFPHLMPRLFHLENEDGKTFYGLETHKKNGNVFVKTFPPLEGESFRVVAKKHQAPDILEDLEVEIPLK